MPTRASETGSEQSSLSSFFARPENIREAYAGLTERQKEIGRLLDAVQQNRRMPIPDPLDRLMAIRAIEPVLEDIPNYALGESYKRALKDPAHDGPFQTGEVVRCWREMSERTKQELYESQTQHRSLPIGPPCEWCEGRGWKRVRTGGIDVKSGAAEDTRHVRRCRCKLKAVDSRKPIS